MFWAFYIKCPISTINLSYIIYIKRIIGIEYNNAYVRYFKSL